jgi:hypothetical protein
MNCAPHGGLCRAADSDQMWSNDCPLSEDFVAQQTLTKCGPNIAPHRKTLSHSGLRPNVVMNCAPRGGLCHAAESDQMWSMMFVINQMFVINDLTQTNRYPVIRLRWESEDTGGSNIPYPQVRDPRKLVDANTIVTAKTLKNDAVASAKNDT